MLCDLELLLRLTEPARSATALFAYVDRAAGGGRKLTLAGAGHCPPLVVGERRCEFVETSLSAPLNMLSCWEAPGVELRAQAGREPAALHRRAAAPHRRARRPRLRPAARGGARARRATVRQDPEAARRPRAAHPAARRPATGPTTWRTWCCSWCGSTERAGEPRPGPAVPRRTGEAPGARRPGGRSRPARGAMSRRPPCRQTMGEGFDSEEAGRGGGRRQAGRAGAGAGQADQSSARTGSTPPSPTNWPLS